MIKKLTLIMLLLFFLVLSAPACKPLAPTSVPGIDKDTFKEPGLKDRDEKTE